MLHMVFCLRTSSVRSIICRIDKYRENSANRGRIVYRIVEEIRKSCGYFPIFARVNCSEGQPGILGFADALDVCRELAHAGIEALDVSALGSMQTGIRTGRNEGCFAPFGIMLKAKLDVPVLLTDGHRGIEHMQMLLDENACDMLVMARPVIREPGLLHRWASGNTTPSDCKSCNLCGRQLGCCCFFGTRLYTPCIAQKG